MKSTLEAFRGRRLRLAAAVCLLLAGPVAADDDDDGPGGAAGSGGAGAAGGGSAGGGGTGGGASGGGGGGGGGGGASGGGGGGSSGSATGGGAAGGSSGSEGRDPMARDEPLGAPGTGSFSRDLRGFLGSFLPGGAASPPAPPAIVQPAPQPARPAPAGPATSVANELAAIGLDAPARARLTAAGFSIIEETPAVFVPGSIARIAPPRGVPLATARDRARALAPAARVDLNHLYRPSSAVAPATTPATAPIGCAARAVGIIDTTVDLANPALAGRNVEVAVRRMAGRSAAGSSHGTAIAALLASALGPTPILAVDAFHRRPDGDAADAVDIAAALALLGERDIRVANLSFAGPPNDVVALATERAATLGMLLAAAAGNDGAQSAPRYPAAYPWVVAVTAVDRQRRPFVRAVRGSHIAFAAPGVGLPAPGRGASLSGTSYAVPFVTAAFAVAMMTDRPDAALARLAASAVDLGAPGRDPVFGWGLIEQPAAACGGTRAISYP
jgi:hypothetical protein